MYLVLPLVRQGSNVDKEDNLQLLDKKRTHKRKFYEILDLTITEKKLLSTEPEPNSYRLLNHTEYQALIDELQSPNKYTMTTKEYYKKYNLINKYEVLEIGGIKKIIKKRSEN